MIRHFTLCVLLLAGAAPESLWVNCAPKARERIDELGPADKPEATRR